MTLHADEKARAVRLLQISKMARSIGQGAMIVAFTLYLRDLQWSATSIGLLLSSGGLLTAGLGLIVGAVSDRCGRKMFVIGYEILALLGAVLLAFNQHDVAICIISLSLGIGRSQSGVPGPVGAAEQAWIAEVVAPERRGMVYSTNSALGFFGMGAGAVIVGQMSWWETFLPGTAKYIPLFLLIALLAVVNLVLLLRAPGGVVTKPRHSDSTHDENAAAAQQRSITRTENILMLKMAGVNALNGFAVGLTSPLLSYWFALRFGVGPAALGPVFALTYFVTGATTLVTGKMTQRVGIVRAVVSVRLASVVFMLLQPVIPFFWPAAIVFTIRSALARSSIGARQALAVSLVRQSRRGMASSLNTISANLPNSLGPTITAAMMDAGQMALPFFTAAGLQFLFGVLYGRMFTRYDPSHAGRSGPFKAKAVG